MTLKEQALKIYNDFHLVVSKHDCEVPLSDVDCTKNLALTMIDIFQELQNNGNDNECFLENLKGELITLAEEKMNYD